MTSYTPVTLITGHDAKGNEYAYTRIEGQWTDLYRDCQVGNSYIANFVLPNVTTVRFGKETQTRQEWEASGTPFVLSDEELAGLIAFHAEPETKPIIRLESSIRKLRTFDDLPALTNAAYMDGSDPRTDLQIAEDADWHDAQATQEANRPL